MWLRGSAGRRPEGRRVHERDAAAARDLPVDSNHRQPSVMRHWLSLASYRLSLASRCLFTAFPRPLTALSMPFLGLSLLFLHLSLPFIAFHCLCLTSHWLSTAYPGLAFRFTRLPRRSLLNINAFRSIKELLPRLVATLRVARLSSQPFRNQHTDAAFCQPQTKLQTGTTRTVT